MKRTLPSAVLALTFLATPCLAQQLSRDDRAALLKVDRVVSDQMLANKIPGVALAVLRKGKVIHLKATGSQMSNTRCQSNLPPSFNRVR